MEVSIHTVKAKRKDNGNWVSGYYWVDESYTCFANEGNDKHYIRCQINIDWGITKQVDYEIIPETLCKCTGLQDFHEHDLVKYEDEDEIYEIVWFDEDCYFGLKGKGHRDTEMLYYKDIFKYLKLLGNKFDKEVII